MALKNSLQFKTAGTSTEQIEWGRSSDTLLASVAERGAQAQRSDLRLIQIRAAQEIVNEQVIYHPFKTSQLLQPKISPSQRLKRRNRSVSHAKSGSPEQCGACVN